MNNAGINKNEEIKEKYKMRKFRFILMVFLMGLTSISYSDNLWTSSTSEGRGDETVTIEEILGGIKESAMNFNNSLQDLIVKQKLIYDFSIVGKIKLVKELHFKYPDVLEQRILEREEKINMGMTMNINSDNHSTYTTFIKSPLSSLSFDNYEINLVGRTTVKGRSAYLLEVKPKDKKGDVIDGKIWIDAEDYVLIRMEGKPIKKEDRANMKNGEQIIEYEKIDNKYWLPVIDIKEGSWMIIKLVSEVTYNHYEINTGWYKQ